MRFILIFLVLAFSLQAKTELYFINKKGEKLKRIGYPGKTTVLKIDKNIKNPKVFFNKKEYPVIKIKNHLLSLIAVNYKTPLGDYKVLIKGDNFKKTLFFRIKDAHYKKERLKVDPKKVHLSKRDLKRVKKEYLEAMKIYSAFTPKKLWRGDFIYPIKSKITSSFGNARIFNSSLKSYHSGTDFRAKMNTKIKASNSGKVVLAKNRFFAGNSIIIDHGLGIYTCYYHLNRFKVRKNQYVKKGEIIALSGKSGRVTAPHLHFSIRINGVQVDPLQAIKTLNSL